MTNLELAVLWFIEITLKENFHPQRTKLTKTPSTVARVPLLLGTGQDRSWFPWNRLFSWEKHQYSHHSHTWQPFCFPSWWGVGGGGRRRGGGRRTGGGGRAVGRVGEGEGENRIKFRAQLLVSCLTHLWIVTPCCDQGQSGLEGGTQHTAAYTGHGYSQK